MTPAQQFEAWRAELVTELEATSAELAPARATLAAAELAHREARSAWHELNAFTAGALRSASDGIAGPLHSRVLNLREALNLAERARGAARAAVEGIELRVADHTLAIDQVDRAITHSRVTPFPRMLESARRKPAAVAFDDVVMPRGAAS